MKRSGVYLLDSQDREQLEALRFDTLVNEGSFVADREAVKWGESDENSSVYGIFSSNGDLLSSMRAEQITTEEGLRSKLDYDHLHHLISFPCGLLGKASTRKDFQQLGLHSYLQYLAYRDFYESGLQYVAATLMPHPGRLEQFKNFGFKFLFNPAGWHRFGYQSNGPTVVAYLDLHKNYGRLMDVLEPKVKGLKERFPLMEEIVETF